MGSLAFSVTFMSILGYLHTSFFTTHEDRSPYLVDLGAIGTSLNFLSFDMRYELFMSWDIEISLKLKPLSEVDSLTLLLVRSDIIVPS